jgi:uncharacterized membrane protein
MLLSHRFIAYLTSLTLALMNNSAPHPLTLPLIYPLVVYPETMKLFSYKSLARTQPTLADLGVALTAGGVSGFAKIRPKISDVLAGTAIAVALMPPLCVVGIALSQGAFAYSGGSFLLFLTNLLGITLACILTFIWGGYAPDFRRMRRALLWFVSLTAVILFPLSISLISLIQQEQLKASIKYLLKRETITLGQQAQLIDIQLFRPTPFGAQNPDLVTITVSQQSGKEVTPRQVQELERFLQQRLKRPVRLVVRAFEYREIRNVENSP